jgi:branched-chain amino acid transport system substrate-binding protein
MFWEERGGTEVAGREVVWHTADDANDPATGITQANALVSEQGIEVLVGPVTTAVGAPVAEEMNRQNIPLLTPVLSDDNVTQRAPIEGLVRIAGWTASQVTHVLGDWAYDQGYRRVATICFDLQFGYEHCGGFSQVFKDRGGEVIEQLWHGIGEEDYSGYIAELRAADPDAVFVGNSGPDSVRFLQAWRDFGLKDEIPLLATETVLDQTSLRSLDAGVAEGLVSVGHWAEGRDAPVTAEFTETFLERYDRMPSYFAAAMYTAARWLEAALEDLGGDTSDPAAFVEAIRGVQLEDTPLGPVSLDDYDSTVLNVYIRQVEERDDGRLWNVVVDTYEDVSQFWTYDPAEYLEQPAYSRDFQG